MSPQSDNVLFVPNRNVLLTEARWGVGNGPTPDDTEGARPAGRAEESPKEADHATGSGSRDGSQRAASTSHAEEPETAWRQSGCACRTRASLEPQNRGRSAVQSDRNPQPGGVSRIWTDFGGRVLGQATRCACKSRNRAGLDDVGQAVASEAQARRQSLHLATTAQPFRRTGAMGYQRARLAGRPRPEAVFDQHDRRRYQPHAGAFRGARLDGREHALVGELSGTERKTLELLHRQSHAVRQYAQNETRRVSRQRSCRAACHPDWTCAERAGHRVDRRAFAPGQRTRGARVWHGTGSAGQGLASGPCQDARGS